MIKMPWNNSTAPNVMIEVTDACNIRCRVCYKKKGTSIKKLDHIRNDVETAMKLRKLHTVTISGGEPTLHPKLADIVKMIKGYGVHVFLLTNGLLINQAYLQELKKSGLDSILFHVDPYQDRPDLSDAKSIDGACERLQNLTRMASSVGLDVSISMTVYDDNTLLAKCSEYFLSNPDITFLFIARGIDPSALFLQADHKLKDEGREKIQNVMGFYKKRYSIEPFAFIPASDGHSTVWISYFIPIIYGFRKTTIFKVRSNFIDSWLMKIPRVMSGRYVHKTKQNSVITLIRIFINSLTTFRIIEFTQFALKLLIPDTKLRHKMIVYDNGPFINDDGNLIYCEYCPTAIVREGQLLSCCTADYGNTYRKP